MEPFKYILSLIFGVFERISTLNQHTKDIENLNKDISGLKDDIKKIEDSFESIEDFIDDVKRKRQIYNEIQVSKAISVEHNLIDEAYDYEIEEIKKCDDYDQRLEKAQEITSSMIGIYNQNVETAHSKSGTPPELLVDIINALSDTVEEIKREYHQEFLDNFQKYTNGERVEILVKCINHYKREMKSRFERKLRHRLYSENKLI